MKVSAELERWLASDGDRTLGSLVDLFESKSFAILFVVLLGVPALPLPTGGATHVFEIIAAAGRAAADSRPRPDLAAGALARARPRRPPAAEASSPG